MICNQLEQKESKRVYFKTHGADGSGARLLSEP